MEEIGAAGTFLDEECHRVFVGGEKLDQRTDAELKSELFERVLMAGEEATVDEDVVAGVFALDDDIHGCRHAS